MPNVDGPGGGGGGDPRTEACERTEKKAKKQKSESTAWNDSGIISEHRSVIQQVATDLKVVMYFRKTSHNCAPWIRMKHQPKPHWCLNAKSISKGNEGATQEWLDKAYAKWDANKSKVPDPKEARFRATWYSREAGAYHGIVASMGAEMGMPLPARHPKYRGKWITGDYDLWQVFTNAKKCEPVCQDSQDFARLMKEINKRLGWDAIQHGPQAQWCPPQIPVSMPEKVKAVLKGGKNEPVPITDKRKMYPLDDPDPKKGALTVVAGQGVTALQKEEERKDALICEGCAE